MQYVQQGTTHSPEQRLSFGFLQGFVLGPILFTIYTTPLGHIIRRHGLSFHLQADDTQLYIAFKHVSPQSKDRVIMRMEACFVDIKSWMNNNFLKLNEDKKQSCS